jgi:hypothetical protein
MSLTRKKRGLLNFGGNVLNFSFGTATSAELQTWHQVVEGVKLQQSAITHSLEHQLTYTKELDENIRQNTRDITLLVRILKLQINDIVKLNRTVKELDRNLTTRLELMANASQRVRELEFFVYSRARVYKDLARTRRNLSAELLPPHNLSLILQ